MDGNVRKLTFRWGFSWIFLSNCSSATPISEGKAKIFSVPTQEGPALLVATRPVINPDFAATPTQEPTALEMLAQANSAVAKREQVYRELQAERRIQHTRAQQAAFWSHGTALPEPPLIAATNPGDPSAPDPATDLAPTRLPFRYHAHPPGSAALVEQRQPNGEQALPEKVPARPKPVPEAPATPEQTWAVRKSWRTEATWAAVIAWVASMVVLVAFLLRPKIPASPQQPHDPIRSTNTGPILPSKTGAGDPARGSLSEAYDRLGYALSGFPGMTPEQILHTAARYRSAGQPGCPIVWRNGLASLQFSGKPEEEGLTGAFLHCSETVEEFKRRRDELAGRMRAEPPH